jgi:methionyl-tRNA formyltransferase
MGTPAFAVPSLEGLESTCDVVGVFSRPDAVSGRGRGKRPSAVAETAAHLGLDVFKPASLADAEAVAALSRLSPDLIVVAAYGAILPAAFLDSAPLGAVNVHASLLPRWRGAAPVQRAILAGDDIVGVSIMRMEAGLDTGPYCLQRSIEVGDSDATALTSALAHLGAAALVEAVPPIAHGTAVWRTQDETLVTYAAKISKDDVAIAPDLAADAVLRRVRASTPAAPCRALVAESNVTVLEARGATTADGCAPGTGEVTFGADGVVLGAADEGVLVTRLKPAGRGAMSAADWARGLREPRTHTWSGLR